VPIFAGILRRESAPNQHRRALFIASVSPRHPKSTKSHLNATRFGVFTIRGVAGGCGSIQAATIPASSARLSARGPSDRWRPFRALSLGLLGRIRQHASTMCWAGLRRAFCLGSPIVQTALKPGRRVCRTLLSAGSAAIQSRSWACLSVRFSPGTTGFVRFRTVCCPACLYYVLGGPSARFCRGCADRTNSGLNLSGGFVGLFRGQDPLKLGLDPANRTRAKNTVVGPGSWSCCRLICRPAAARFFRKCER